MLTNRPLQLQFQTKRKKTESLWLRFCHPICDIHSELLNCDVKVAILFHLDLHHSSNFFRLSLNIFFERVRLSVFTYHTQIKALFRFAPSVIVTMWPVTTTLNLFFYFILTSIRSAHEGFQHTIRSDQCSSYFMR